MSHNQLYRPEIDTNSSAALRKKNVLYGDKRKERQDIDAARVCAASSFEVRRSQIMRQTCDDLRSLCFAWLQRLWTAGKTLFIH